MSVLQTSSVYTFGFVKNTTSSVVRVRVESGVSGDDIVNVNPYTRLEGTRKRGGEGASAFTLLSPLSSRNRVRVLANEVEKKPLRTFCSDFFLTSLIWRHGSLVYIALLLLTLVL